MRLTMSGIHMDTGDALKTHAEKKVADLEAYFDQIQDVALSFTHESHNHGADLTLHASGITLRGEGVGNDPYSALDDAFAKASKQLEKYKGRLVKHRERRQKFAEKMKDFGPLDMVASTVEEREFDDVPADMFAEFAPTIVKKDVSRVAPMTVDEAVMQMDLLHRPAFLFLNVATGALNMVHREGDNTVRWVAPKKIGD